MFKIPVFHENILNEILIYQRSSYIQAICLGALDVRGNWRTQGKPQEHMGVTFRNLTQASCGSKRAAVNFRRGHM